MSTRLTDKRILLLHVVASGTGNLSNYWLDLDQILDKLNAYGWKVTKASLQFVVRSLVEGGLIEKRSYKFRKGFMRRRLATMQKGREVLRGVSDDRIKEIIENFNKRLQ